MYICVRLQMRMPQIECPATTMDANTDAVVDADVSAGADVECKYGMRIWV